jgi:hypothetical protein
MGSRMCMAASLSCLLVAGCRGRDERRGAPEPGVTHQAEAKYNAPPPVTDDPLTPTGEPVPESVVRRYAMTFIRAASVLTISRGGDFRCDWNCNTGTHTLKGRAYRARGGLALPGLGRGGLPLLVPLDSDGNLLLSQDLLNHSAGIGCP